MGAKSARGYWNLIILLAMFVIPWVIAHYLFHSPEARPMGQVNRGILLKEPLQQWSELPLLPLRPLADISAQTFRLVWHHDTIELSSIPLEKLQRIQRALGKVCDRVKITLLLPSALSKMPPIDADFFSWAPNATPTLATGLYLVMPNGDIVLTYPAAFNSRNVLKDLNRLIHVANLRQ